VATLVALHATAIRYSISDFRRCRPPGTRPKSSTVAENTVVMTTAPEKQECLHALYPWEIGAIKGEVNINHIAVQVAQLVNHDTKGKQIAGFKPPRRR